MNTDESTLPIRKIGYIDGPRFAQAVVAGAGRVIRMAPHLNEINVFPVADHDTGSNMAATMRALAAGAHLGKIRSLSAVSEAIADSGLLDARGNSGSILVELFYGLAESFARLERVTASQFAAALANASRRAAGAVAEPREGTILTVLRVFADYMETQAGVVDDFSSLFGNGIAVVRSAVDATTGQLDVLGESHVVDAGALGFLFFLEGVAELIETGNSDEELPMEDLKTELVEHGPLADAESKFRYCTECILVGTNLNRSSIRTLVEPLGDSVIVAGSSRQARLHLHCDQPGKVFRALSQFGEVQRQKAEDMTRQKVAYERSSTQSVAIITDAGCDLPAILFDEWNIHLVPHRISFGKDSYIAKVTIDADEFYDELSRRSEHPQTSQPTPADYIRTFEFISSRFKNAVCLHMSGKLSGTFQTGQQLAARISDRIHVIDTKTCSVGLGLIVREAAKEARAGGALQSILDGIDRRIRSMRSLLCVDTLKYLIKGGRLGRLKGLLGQMMGVKPIFQFDETGGLQIAGRASFRRSVHEALLEKCVEIGSAMKRPKIAVAHASAIKWAERFASEFMKRLSVSDILITPLSPVMGVHGGKNCVGVALMDEGVPVPQPAS